MPWLIIAAAFLFGICLLIFVCYFIKFHFSFTYEMPKTWVGAVQIAFFNFKQEWQFNSNPPSRPLPSPVPTFPDNPSQAGFIRFPSEIKIPFQPLFSRLRNLD